MSDEKRIDLVAGVLVLNDSHETLLIKRRLDAHVAQGQWTRPIGGVEFGETGAQAAIRETLEETGVNAEISKPVPISIWEYIRREQRKHSVVLDYLGVYVAGEACNTEPDKHDEVRWFPLTALPENLSDGTRRVIELFQGK